MGDRVIGRVRRAALVVVWTFALALGLRGLDAWIAGAPPAREWAEAASLDDVPSAALLPGPAYIPGYLAWPPRRILYRVDGRGREGRRRSCPGRSCDPIRTR